MKRRGLLPHVLRSRQAAHCNVPEKFDFRFRNNRILFFAVGNIFLAKNFSAIGRNSNIFSQTTFFGICKNSLHNLAFSLQRRICFVFVEKALKCFSPFRKNTLRETCFQLTVFTEKPFQGLARKEFPAIDPANGELSRCVALKLSHFQNHIALRYFSGM